MRTRPRVRARRGEWRRPNFLTAYQILERLPAAIRDTLIAERTIGGRGTGTSFSAVTAVAMAAALIPGVVTEYMDCVGSRCKLLIKRCRLDSMCVPFSALS